MLEIEKFTHRDWDVIIIGTGIGGATMGHALAKAGKSVLFCEKGKSHLNDSQSLRGNFAETFFQRPSVPAPEHHEILATAGRSYEEIEDRSKKKSTCFVPFTGCGTGGSSAIYGMAMERFFPEDFKPGAYYEDIPGSEIVENWPISYDELTPYYEAAEKLYRLRGTADKARGNENFSYMPPPALNPATQELNDFFISKGLNPYRLPSACEFVEGCHGCQGYLCNGNCRNGSDRICLTPALDQFDAHLIDNCSVLRIEANSNSVTGVVCLYQGQEYTLSAKTVALAAGALATPGILLNSASPDWPDGLANNSGLVGRNMMRHFIDLYVIFPKNSSGHPGNLKELALNDFYFSENTKYGTFQSFGLLPPVSVIAENMVKDIRDGAFGWLAWPFMMVKPIVKTVIHYLFSRGILFATIMEDLPYRDNRVMLTKGVDKSRQSRLTIKYRVRKSDLDRIKALRKKVKKMLRPYRFMVIKQAENNERIAHVCGTCRFGHDPATSVLDKNNKAHGLSNLYVVDSSFFPSSAGTNPGLTIAANALRVADAILSGKGD